MEVRREGVEGRCEGEEGRYGGPGGVEGRREGMEVNEEGRCEGEEGRCGGEEGRCGMLWYIAFALLNHFCTLFVPSPSHTPHPQTSSPSQVQTVEALFGREGECSSRLVWNNGVSESFSSKPGDLVWQKLDTCTST